MRNSALLDALFPRTRQAILGTLLIAPERRWRLTDLAAHLTSPPSSLQRELASLTEEGILRREYDGRQTYYRADVAFPLFPELQSIFAKTMGLTDQVRDTLAPFLDRIEFAFIFGSVARGERTSGSDLDLMVVGDVGMADLSLPLRELKASLNIPVNVTHFSPAEFRRTRRENNHFLQTVLHSQKIFIKGSDHELDDVHAAVAMTAARHA